MDADEDGQTKVGELGEKALVPERSTFRSRRQIFAFWSSRIAKSHRDKCNSRRIIEDFFVQPGPLSEAVAALVAPGDATFVNLGARRLTDDDDAGLGSCLNNWPWSVRQMSCTQLAAA